MNARIRKVMTLTALGLGLTAAAWAGTAERLGTGGNSESRILIVARSVALAYSNLGSVSGAEALFGNPAGLAATENKTELLFSHADYLADMNLNYLALSQNMGSRGIVGFSVKVLSVGTMIRTTEEAPDGTGDTFSPTFTTFGVSYAKALTDRVNFGATAHVISEAVLQTHSTGVSFDFGFQYDTGVNGIRVGAAMQNVGPAALFGGSDFERNLLFPDDDPQAANRTVAVTSSAAELPTLFAGSASWPLVTGDINTLTVHGLYQSNSFNVDEFRFGAEYGYRKDFALRVGYKATSNDNELFGLTYGLGVRLPLGGSHVTVDYAGQQVSDFFDDVQHLGLTFRF